MIRTQTRQAHARIEVTYKGSLKECFDGIQSEWINYPVAGYGGSATIFYDPLKRVYVARISRAESCD